MIIHGDNLLSLKALESKYAGKVKCIYIDPPYNTGYAFEHYDDNLEHSTWLSLMKPRLEILRSLLSYDGSIWISIDADESHYLKVLCDEVFGRKNFIDEVVWQRSYSPINLKKTLSRCHDNILVYAKEYSINFELNKLPRTETANKRYKNPDNDPRGVWKIGDMSVGPRVDSNVYKVITPSGREVYPPEGRSWFFNEDRFKEMLTDNRIWFGKNGNNVPSVKRFLTETKQGIVALTMWFREEVGDSQEGKKEVKLINSNSVLLHLKVGRSNWLFANTPNGANASTMIYSIIQSAILNNLIPQKYLTFVFDTIQSGRNASHLVPWSDEIPESCKNKKSQN